MERTLFKTTVLLLILFSSACDIGLHRGPPSGSQSSYATCNVDALNQRLTNREYLNTLKAIFGTEISGLLELPYDANINGFDAFTEDLGLDDFRIETYIGNAQKIADYAIPELKKKYPNLSSVSTQQSIIRKVGRLAFRRPLASQEVEAYLSLLEEADSPEEGLRAVLTAFFSSPYFVLRLPEAPPYTGYYKDVPFFQQIRQAARISYFLWGMPPDGELSLAAESGQTAKDAERKNQIQRMIADPKFSYFLDGFITQWLRLDLVKTVAKESNVISNFDSTLRNSMIQETLEFVKYAIQSNLTVNTLLSGKFTFLNDRLANHYNVPGTFDSTRFQLQSYSSDDRQHYGIMTQGSIAALTSIATRTSPTIRGNWMMKNLLCQEIPKSPNMVGMFTDDTPPDATISERLALHRTKPECAACHNVMDPIGLGLENYDPLGRWRTVSEGKPIDASGKLPEIGDFKDLPEMVRLLTTTSNFQKCFAEKVFIYASGRLPNDQDNCSYSQVESVSTSASGGLKDVLTDIALRL